MAQQIKPAPSMAQRFEVLAERVQALRHADPRHLGSRIMGVVRDIAHLEDAVAIECAAIETREVARARTLLNAAEERAEWRYRVWLVVMICSAVLAFLAGRAGIKLDVRDCMMAETAEAAAAACPEWMERPR